MSKVYIFLGTRGCGRRRLLAQLVEEGLSGTTTLCIAEHERDAEKEKIFSSIPTLEVTSWKLYEDSNVEVSETGAEENLILLTDGEGEPVDQMEAFTELAKRRPEWRVSRVVTVLDCALAANVPESATWFRACVHFSDVVLLANRENVSAEWMKSFEKAYTKECLPCIFSSLKKGRAENPALVLDDTPRRMSMIFDDRDPIDEIEFDEDNLPEEPFDLVNRSDPYFEITDAGTRKIVLPKTGDLLSAWDKIRQNEQ